MDFLNSYFKKATFSRKKTTISRLKSAALKSLERSVRPALRGSPVSLDISCIKNLVNTRKTHTLAKNAHKIKYLYGKKEGFEPEIEIQSVHSFDYGFSRFVKHNIVIVRNLFLFHGS